MDEYLRANQKLWNEWTDEHEKSPFYDLEGFRTGRERLKSIELEEVGDVRGKKLLHLQCHFGLDTLAWARHGAVVTGVDLSDQSIALAQSLSRELDIPANFVCSDILTLADVLDDQFDIVFTSYGVLHWLRDLRRWARVIAHFLKPGGFSILWRTILSCAFSVPIQSLESRWTIRTSFRRSHTKQRHRVRTRRVSKAKHAPITCGITAWEK
jgi:2-polyprenyl-3-methyl-5-hydroxy-6-metoxy-1,4-benzoquinol methylase